MKSKHRLLRWILPDLEPALRQAVVELYQEESSRLSVKCFAFYFFAKLVWLVLYSIPSKHPNANSKDVFFGWDAAKRRALVCQLIQLLVMACLLGPAFWRYRKGLPLRIPRVLLCLPVVLASVSATLHVESIRFAIDKGKLSDSVDGHSCLTLVEDFWECDKRSADFFLHPGPNTSQNYHLAYHAARDACNKNPAIAQRGGSMRDAVKDGCFWKCFDQTTLNSLTAEFITHFLVLLPAELGVLLMLPSWLIVALPTGMVCGSAKWSNGTRVLLHGEKDANWAWNVGQSGNPLILLAVCFCSVGVSCMRGRLQLEIAKQITLARKDVVHEKVKRCEAEFKAELSKSQPDNRATNDEQSATCRE